MTTVARALSLERETSSVAPLHLSVVYTSPKATRTALRAAVQLASDLDARIRVIVPKTVPYPLAIDNPPVSMRFDRQKTMAFVDEIAKEASVLMCYCRDEVEALLYLFGSGLPPARSRSVIVIGGKDRRWFSTKAQRIARRLREAGCRVVFITSRN